MDTGPDEAFIGTIFNDAYGSSSKPNSVLRWWPYGIRAHYNNVENSEQSAFRCYIRKVDSCAFYYKGSGSGYCHLGHFNGRWHSALVGGYEGNFKYHIMYGKILVSSLLSRLLSYSDLYMK